MKAKEKKVRDKIEVQFVSSCAIEQGFFNIGNKVQLKTRQAESLIKAGIVKKCGQ